MELNEEEEDEKENGSQQICSSHKRQLWQHGKPMTGNEYIFSDDST